MRVLFFSQVRQAAGLASIELSTGELGVDEFWHTLIALHPALAAHRSKTRLARNGVFVGADARFLNEDEIALIPPVSGG